MSINELDMKVKELRELRRMAEELQAEIDAAQDTIKTHMDSQGVDTLAGTDWKVTWKPVTSSRMDTGALRKHMLSDNRLIGRDMHPRIGLDQTTGLVYLFLPQVRLLSQLILDDGKDAAQWSITRTLSQTVHGRMDSLDTRTDGGIYIRYGKIIVVMRMEVKP